ncbi:PAS domain-containing sensor histidine kinase [Paracoccus benzoatiresistens]|uniref:histidine kinase n=1 Tax=Paracoccus benzoatiresistens TaxID=2997341 RepID=A0ABT4JAN0_9RHOB|nr:PAS domain S-box protein [Paracoccus sp. EF6]MCZ0964189.1 PAS domain S-box protein [Paracoccus sp. EF6]
MKHGKGIGRRSAKDCQADCRNRVGKRRQPFCPYHSSICHAGRESQIKPQEYPESGKPQHALEQHFAAIIEGSNDAIMAKDLGSIILSWNPAAERIFGYRANEMLGRSITLLIPEDRQHEEVDFINRLRRGERIQHFETMRRKKNGQLFPISVSISPIRNRQGQVVGASKIARDITAQHRLLLAEMKHRVGNSFAIASGLLNLCARQATTMDDLVVQTRGRFLALAAAHSLTAPGAPVEDAAVFERRPLHGLIEAILKPFAGSLPIDLAVEDVLVGQAAVTPLALVFDEPCTNSVKYGALSQDSGGLAISSEHRGDRLIIHWDETFAPVQAGSTVQGQGFGTIMCELALRDQLDGSFRRQFTNSGMHASLDLSHARLSADPQDSGT